MRRAGATHNPGVSLFPFLAVLICTMGVMMLLLVIINRPGAAAIDDSQPPPDAVFGEGGDGSAALLAAANGEAADQDKAKSAGKKSSEQLALDRQLLDLQISKLKMSRDKTMSDLRDERLRLATVEDGIRDLRSQWEKVTKAAGDIDRVAVAKTHDVDEIEAAIARLKESLNSTHFQISKAVDAARFQPPAYAIVPYDGASGTRRQPIYIECRSDAVVLQPEGIELTPKDFKGPNGPGNPLASTIRAVRDYLAGGTAPMPGREPYPLLIVRSDGIEAFYLAKTELESWGSDFGYELVEADRKIVYQQPFPQLAQIERAALADARSRYAWFATNDAGKADDEGHSRASYRTSRNGGMRRDGAASLADDASGNGGDGSSSGGFGFGSGTGTGGKSIYTSGGSGTANTLAGNGAGGSGTGSAGVGGNGVGGNGVGRGGNPNATGIGYSGLASGDGPGGGSGLAYAIGGSRTGVGTTSGMTGNGNSVASGGMGGNGFGGSPVGGNEVGGGAPGSATVGGGAGYGTGASGGPGGNGSPSASLAGAAAGGQPFVPGSNYMGLPGGNNSSGGTNNGAMAGPAGSGQVGSGDTNYSSGSANGAVAGNANLAGMPTGMSSGTNYNAGNVSANGISGTAGSSSSSGNGTSMSTAAQTGYGASQGGAGTSGPPGGSPGDPNFTPSPGPAGNLTLAQAGSNGGNSDSAGDSSGAPPSGLAMMMQKPREPQKQSSDAYNTNSLPSRTQTDSDPHIGEYIPPAPEYIPDKPKPKNEIAPQSHDSLAEKRGPNWSLPSIARLSTPVERTIHIECRGDCVVLKPGIGNPQPRVIPFGPRTADSVDKLVAAVWDYARGWGIAGEKMYWKPKLQLEVGLSGEGRIADLKALMRDSGLNVTSKPVAMANTGAMPYR